MKTGLVSISFRKKTPEEIISLVLESGLQQIEWGGDVHVPHGDLQQAKKVSRLTTRSGLSVACYGSYYRAGSQREDQPSQDAVLETALALEAPMIRIWAGDKGSAQMSQEDKDAIVRDIQDLTQGADKHGLKIALEYHGNTLTDTDDTTEWLLSQIDHPALSSLWQPRVDVRTETNKGSISRFLPRISNVHVFHWEVKDKEKIRHPLATGSAEWEEYLQVFSSQNVERSFLLEFISGDSEKQLIEDAATLQDWLKKLKL